jgi:hypothetical protein
MKEPRVIEVIEAYSKGNLKQVLEYLTQSDMRVDANTWSGKVKKMIEDEEFYSAKALIETTAYKFINTKK